ncbi:putative RNA-dependent RNA polymerase 5 [Sesbania bispinosa]|nr:putative RNA-dependent RNA polymerase 5 [Sesbania bispinosa]
MQATFVENLHCYVGDGDNALFLPHQGSSSRPDGIATGDIAPEIYWVSTNPQFPFLHHLSHISVKITSRIDYYHFLNKKLLKNFKQSDQLRLTSAPSKAIVHVKSINAIQLAADSWMTLMDRLLTLRDLGKERQMDIVKRNMLTLVDIYKEALHGNKIGRRKLTFYTPLTIFPRFLQSEITKLTQFMVQVPVGYMEMWKALHFQYMDDITNAFHDNYNRKHEAAKFIDLYKEQLYGAAEMDYGPKNLTDIYYEALALYHVTYDYAAESKDVQQCGFAWKVGGEALMRLYTIQQGDAMASTAFGRV